MGVIEFDQVSKRFGEVSALDKVSFRVGKGEIFGLLGPNGSGKSTAMRLCVGILRPDEGSVRVLGHDTKSEARLVKRLVGYSPEEPRLYDFLSGYEYLNFVSGIYGLEPEERREKIDRFVEAFGLEGKIDEEINGYSRGMRQKVSLIAAMLHDPEVLVLDEPVAGLDPRSARIVKELLKGFKRMDRSILISTHILGVAEAICDRVALMRRGRLLVSGRIDELLKMGGLEDVFLELECKEDLREVVEALLR